MLTGAAVAEADAAFTHTVILAAAAMATVLSVLMYEIAQAATIAHEGTHALFTVLTGNRLGKNKISIFPGGGETDVGELPWLSDLIVTAGGYLGPSIFGLAGAAILTTGHPDTVLWLTVVLLAVMVFFTQNLRAFVQVLLFGFGFYLIASSAPPYFQALAAFVWVWWLLIGAVVGALRLGFLLVSGRISNKSDAHFMRRLTWIPATIWIVLFIVATTLTLVYGGAELMALGD